MGCPYKFILGIPGQGFHAPRLLGLAMNDTIGTIVLAIGTSYFFKIDLINSLLGWFIGGEILHYIFGVQTEFLTKIGISACS